MQFRLNNFTIENFNRDINNSGDLLGKYKAWGGYRKQLSAFIGNAFKYNPQINRALVMGAGNLNDLDLHDLCTRLEWLTLSDTDITGMENGISRQNLSDNERGKIGLLKTDYTGANEKVLFKGLENLVKRGVAAGELALFIKEAFSAMAESNSNGFAEKYSLVISCPIYTQLIYTQIEVFLKMLFEAGLYAYHELNKILYTAYCSMPGMIASYNDVVINTCNDRGLIVLLSDIIEMEKNSAVYREVKKAEKDGCVDRQEAEKLMKRHGLELAQIGCKDFTSKTEVTEDMYAIWPFEEKKEYLVYGCLSKKRG